MGKNNPQAAWGLDATSGQDVRLVRLVRQADGWAVTQARQAPRPAGQPASQVAASVAAGAAGEAVAVAVSDQDVLYRAVSVPAAQDAGFRAMMAAQIEVLIPGEMSRFVTAWQAAADPHRPSMRRCVLCAARRDAVDEALAASRGVSRDGRGAFPSTLALAAMWGRRGDDKPVLLVHLAEQSTAVAAMRGACVISAGVADSALDSAADAAVRVWARQVREVVEHAVAEIPRDQRPVRCILFAPAAQAALGAAALTEALHIPVEPAAPPADVQMAGADFATYALAIALAQAAADEGDGPANFVPAKAARTPVPLRRAWRWAAVFVWIAAAVAVLYGLDVHEAAVLDRDAQDMQKASLAGGGLARQRAVGDFLESTAGPLDILERLSTTLPESAMLTTWRYSRDGEHVIGGIVPDEAQFLQVLDTLHKLGTVQWKTGRVNEGKFQFEVCLNFTRAAAAASSKPASSPGAPGTGPAADGSSSRPQSSPAGRPAITDAASPLGASGPAPQKPAAELTPAPRPEVLQPLVPSSAGQAEATVPATAVLVVSDSSVVQVSVGQNDQHESTTQASQDEDAQSQPDMPASQSDDETDSPSEVHEEQPS
jgi:hypothetical protein